MVMLRQSVNLTTNNSITCLLIDHVSDSMEWQIILIPIRTLLSEWSDLGLHYLSRPLCLDILDKYIFSYIVSPCAIGHIAGSMTIKLILARI